MHSFSASDFSFKTSSLASKIASFFIVTACSSASLTVFSAIFFAFPTFFSIKNLISKPEKENQIEIWESEQEKQIDEYLKDTYNLTKILNSKKEVKQVITKKQET